MSKEINLKIDQVLLDKVKTISKIKHPLRKIDSYAEATREALIEYVNKNRRYLKQETEPEANEKQLKSNIDLEA